MSFDSAGRIAITKGMLVDVGMLWSAAGVVGGFQVAAFTLRIHREIEVGSEDDLTWLPVADCLNLLSLSITLIGVFVLPVLGVIGHGTASRIFGLAAVLLLGWAFALAGHYELYNPKTARSYRYFPLQERVATAVVAVSAVTYVVIALIK